MYMLYMYVQIPYCAMLLLVEATNMTNIELGTGFSNELSCCRWSAAIVSVAFIGTNEG